MDVNPTAGQTPAERNRRKSSPTQGKAGSPKITVPKITVEPARSRKKSVQQPDKAVEQSDLSQTIATGAYFLAASRNFEPGRELEDWLEAERRVRETAR